MLYTNEVACREGHIIPPISNQIDTDIQENNPKTNTIQAMQVVFPPNSITNAGK